MRRFLCIFLVAGGLAVGLRAQPSNGYVFFAPGGVSCCGYTTMSFHAGLGGEWVLGKGVGLGAEIGALGQRDDFADSVLGVFSTNGYYHFAHRKRLKLDPFVTGGYSLFFRYGTENLFNFGGGFTYWTDGHLGLRLEARDHVYRIGGYVYSPSQTLHYWGVRVGLALR